MSPMEARYLLWIQIIQSLGKEGIKVIKIEPYYYLLKIKPERHIYVYLNRAKGNASITRLFQYCDFTNPIDVLDNPHILKQYCNNIHVNY